LHSARCLRSLYIERVFFGPKVHDDILNGCVGTDVLTGGAGADVFEFRGLYGIDTITDFADGDQLGVGQGINGQGEVTVEDC